MVLPVTLIDLAALQHGVVGLEQAVAAGMTQRRVGWLVRSGHWQRVHARVYATFTGPLPFEAQVWAAILRAGRGAVASHRTAAFLDGLCDDPGPLIHVTLPADRHVRSRVDGVGLHYAHRLCHTRHPTLSPPRTRVEDTVLDLVDATARPREVETWVTSACQRRLTTPERLADALGRRKKIRWRPMLESMLGDVAAGAQSPLELRHLRAVERAHAMPRGHRQRRVAGSRVIWVDVDYDRYALRIELDGRVGHVDDGRFRDRRRDNRATSDGRATLRYGHSDVFGDPCGVAAEQGRVLRDRGWTGRPRACGPDCPVPMIINGWRRHEVAVG
ncbi:type IV toxin-antitoxin system AbiEi family antitoxin domain-containing protein [Jiangella asiatica]|uniref:Type IV toxin-antitoxin system AbiEi family antitoxin domain-containing protein n=1 Tax=Jiangella asiatica TaxID=2530372 RepID=A0A4V2Z026_9ACTN|nr:type IV toxin-antitoxin system AbiEi family antitoxin domain-containing protein [Jiangella asiatica]TDD98867.1 hypothetical protein E1269_28460 [Jiangella asiatica]